MTLPPPTYDLMLLLDPEAEEQVRVKILADARAMIEAQGELVRDDQWGDRALAYPVHRKAVADYHLIQFHAGTPELIAALDRSLRIADGVMRFRIVKLKPGVPAAPDMRAASAASPSPQASAPSQEPLAAGEPS